MEHLFRNAAFNGFNRQDVMSYLEKITEQNTRELEEQRDHNQSLQMQLDETNRKLDEAVRGREQAENQLNMLRSRLEQAEKELAALREKELNWDAQLDSLQEENLQLLAQVEKLEPDAQAYSAVKERTAGMELQAHRRAQDVEQQAQEYARKLRDKMEQWLAAVEQQYDALRHEVESTVSHAADQLGKAGQSLEKVNQLMEEQNVELKLLTQSYQQEENQ